MTSHRIRHDLPSAVRADADVERFAARLAASLMPELVESLGTVHVEDRHGVREVWNAIGWRADGAEAFE